MSERYYRCACGSSSAALPSQALRAKAGLRHPASASLSLASCWPLPQQLLPVPAAGGGRRRCPQRGSLGLCGMQKPLPMGEVAAKQTERASPAGQSCHAAISRPSVRAILSLRLWFLVSGLALSGAARQGRVAAPSVCFAVACILLAAAPTAPPCFRRWRRSSPLPPEGEPLRKTKTAPSRKIPRWSGDIQEMLSRRC